MISSLCSSPSFRVCLSLYVLKIKAVCRRVNRNTGRREKSEDAFSGHAQGWRRKLSKRLSTRAQLGERKREISGTHLWASPESCGLLATAFRSDESAETAHREGARSRDLACDDPGLIQSIQTGLHRELECASIRTDRPEIVVRVVAPACETRWIGHARSSDDAVRGSHSRFTEDDADDFFIARELESARDSHRA